MKDHDNNHEFRYSLRSLENLPHGKVFVVGYKPTWCTEDVLEIEKPDYLPQETKYIKSTMNLIAAMDDPRLSEDFVLMNDDFFIMEPIEYVPVLHRESLVKMIDWYYKKHQNSPYTQGLLRVFKRLEVMGINDALSYELHVPMVFNKTKFREILEMSMELEGFGKRTLYGNIHDIGGDYFADVKFTNQLRPIEPFMPFVSTDEGSFTYHPIGEHLRQKFQKPSKYEKELPWVKYPRVLA